jgi:dienelactone hydrolase
MRRVFAFVAMACALVLAPAAQGQDLDASLRKLLRDSPAVRFVQEPVAEEPGSFTTVSNVTFKPKGDGPFPAVVLVHTCGGVQDAHMREHARELLALGYVVLLQDSFGPRGRRNCGENNASALSMLVGVNDAYAALAHLQSYSFVDREHIYLAGYSWGAGVAQMLPGAALAGVLEARGRFRATVANYNGCIGTRGPWISPATDRPVLLLLGAKDTETSPSSCFPLLEELKAKGLPVSWHVYPEATHGWDKTGLGRLGYRYDLEISRDATRRMTEFFQQNR